MYGYCVLTQSFCSILHMGHFLEFSSHVLMQIGWYSWKHCNSISVSPGFTFSKQILHSASSKVIFSSNVFSMSPLLNPCLRDGSRILHWYTITQAPQTLGQSFTRTTLSMPGPLGLLLLSVATWFVFRTRWLKSIYEHKRKAYPRLLPICPSSWTCCAIMLSCVSCPTIKSNAWTLFLRLSLLIKSIMSCVFAINAVRFRTRSFWFVLLSERIGC